MLTQVQYSRPSEEEGEGEEILIRPFFLRLGYEVNNPENNYCPDRYKEAYRKLIRRLREAGLVFASVWHVVPGEEAWDWEAFYPGDEWVDWIGTSTFFAEHLQDAPNVTTNYEYQAELMQFAQAHNKPVMIAESSPVQYGVAACAGEGGLPNDDEINCGVGDATAGQAAWDFWFARYFDFIDTFENIKAVCYINSDWDQATSVGGFLGEAERWKKDARLSQNDYTRDAYRAEVQSALYRKRQDVDSALGGCQPISVITDGQEWMRLLPTGDFVLTKGKVHADWTDWSATGPMKNPLAYAIANASGQILLAITADTGDLYLRGQVFEQQVIDRTALPPSFIFAEGTLDTDPVHGAVTDEGDVFVRGAVLLTRTLSADLPDSLFPANDEYYGLGCNRDSTEAHCDCFEYTNWWSNDVCVYDHSKGLPPNILTVKDASGQPWLIFDSIGNCYLLNGDVYQDDATPPQGVEEIVLAQLNGTTLAKIVLQELSGETRAHLWIKGRVVVANSGGVRNNL